MKRCSRWTFFLGMLLLPILGFGQSFPVDGFLFDSSGGPISGTAVNLEYPLPNGGWALDSAITDPTGYFDFGTINTTTQGAMLLYAQCSFTSSVLDTLLFNPSTTGWTATLTCSPVSNGPCTAVISVTHTPSPLNPYLYFIQPIIGNNGPGTNYFFTYGNGNSGYSGGSSQSYPGPGVYTICLTVTNGNCIDTVCQTLTVAGSTGSCNAQFTDFTSNGVTFLAADSTFNSPTATYSWDLGDGNTATGPFVPHTYNSPGSYLVCLTVADPTVPCVDTVCQTVTISSTSVCAVSATITSQIADTISFAAQAITGNGPFTYLWDFGDGSTSTSQNPTHVYASPGFYTACVTMTDGSCVSTQCVSVVITGSACNASFGYNSWQGTTYFYADTTFLSPTATYVWDLGDGTINFGPNITHNYATTDTYYVCLIVSDPATGCADSTCQWIYATGTGGGTCTADFGYYVFPGTNDVSFTPFNNGPSGIDSVFWSFGDGTSSTTNTLTHTYASSGYYQVCVTVYYNNGCVATECKTVYVPSGLCNSNFVAFPISSSSYFFSAVDSLLPPSSYTWTLGDGTTASGPYVSHTYNTADTFEVCLIVTDTASNCSDTTCQYIVTSGGGASCQAAFSYQISGGGQVHFVNQSSGVTPASSFFWDLGDGSTSTAINPVNTYVPGTYNVCLIIQTALCYDSICQTIVVGNTPGCDATFTTSTSPTGGPTVFTPVNPIQGALYILDPGDGSVPVFGTPPLTHVYTASGVYGPCLTVIDSLSGCTATYCDTVIINTGTPGNCQAMFNYFPAVGNNTFLFLDSSAAPGAQIFYSWDFGDGTTSTQQDPVHTFNTPGPWLVCLAISDGLGCADTFCQVVQPINTPGTYSVSGVVVTDSLLGTQSIVYLIEHDNVLNTLTAIDSQFAAFGFYQFNNVQPGTYLVKAGLTPGSPVYANYLPTYHGDVMTWNAAISTVVTNTDVWNLPITLIQGNNPGGPAFIGGLISQGANKNGDPLPNISVLLMTIDEDPVTHTITNEDGEYEFPNLAYGTYIVHVEVAGKVAEDWVVTLDANNPSFTIGDFDVHTDHIDAVGTTSISNGLDPASVRVYPNPSSGVVNIALDLEENSARIELRNSLGAIIETVETSSGSVTRQLDLSSLASGVYLIQVSTENGSVSHRVMKK